eukprot:GGOE01050654.1.p2 GENE.GGOE01050654.1~~GGOE01050654.1.p2  ORF type:complete len:151 (+),score=25.35 GGOE01050654.1:25-477(+)
MDSPLTSWQKSCGASRCSTASISGRFSDGAAADLSTSALAHAAWAVAILPQPPRAIIDALLERALSERFLDTCSAWDLSTLAWAFVRLRRLPPKLLAGMAHNVLLPGRLAEFGPWELSYLAHTFRSVGSILHQDARSAIKQRMNQLQFSG